MNYFLKICRASHFVGGILGKIGFDQKRSFRYLFGNKSFMNLFESFLTTNFDHQASKLEDHHMHVVLKTINKFEMFKNHF